MFNGNIFYIKTKKQTFDRILLDFLFLWSKSIILLVWADILLVTGGGSGLQFVLTKITFNYKDYLDFTLSLYFPRSSFAFVFSFEYFSSLSFSFCLASNCLSLSYWKDIKSQSILTSFYSFLLKILNKYLLFFFSNTFSCLFFCVTFWHFWHGL